MPTPPPPRPFLSLPLGVLPRLSVVFHPCPCARCSPGEDVIQRGDLFATVPSTVNGGCGWIVCLPCAALLIAEADVAGGCPPPDDVLAAIRAAARPAVP